MSHCYWWNRWYHQRQRNIDVIVLLPSIHYKAMMRATNKYPSHSDEWDREVERLTDLAFELHQSLPGQEHWHCECSR